MTKLYVSLMMTLDGYFEGPEHELDWHLGGPAFDDYCDELLDGTDLLVMGRRSYDGMIAYWPQLGTPFAAKMNRVEKLVLTSSSAPLTWNARPGGIDEVRAVKARAQRPIAMFGGAQAMNALRRADLIDEYRVVLTPIFLGRGRRPFEDHDVRQALRLTRASTLSSGASVLYYDVRS
ncbi:MAG: dihydrofolate reductase family protein [Kofleriaceae bacterium]